MNNTTTSFGPLVTVGVPWPKGLSDLAGFKTRPLFLGVSYDFLSSRKYDAAAKARRLDKLQDKLTLEAGTLITISDKEIEFTYRAVYQVRMPVPKADVPRWADFIAIRFGLFDLSGIGMTNGKFSLVYSHGMLAPVYERGHALGGGFYLKF